MKNILLTTDFSQDSERIIEAAKTLFPLSPGRITLLHVLAATSLEVPLVYPGGTFTAPSTEALDAARDRDEVAKAEAMATFAGIMARLDAPVPVGLEVRIGPPADVICNTASELECDLIIIASHGHGLVRRLVLGSTAQYVVNHAPCHVLVLRPDTAHTAELEATPGSAEASTVNVLPVAVAPIPAAAGCVI